MGTLKYPFILGGTIMILSRYIKRNFLLLISLVGILSILSCGISYVITFSKENKENNYYFSNSTYSLIFPDNSNPETNYYKKIIDTFCKEKNINLFNTKMKSYFGVAQGLYLNYPLTTHPQIKEGRFFTIEDFKDNNKKLALVGVSLVQNIKVINGKKTINFNGSDYEVIGIMGDEKYSKEVNYQIFFNLNSLIDLNCDFKTKGWFISSPNNLDMYLYSLQNSIKGLGFVYSPSERITNPVLSVLNSQGKTFYYGLTLFLSIFVNVFIVILFWFDGLIKEIGVRKSFGANNINIYLYIFKKFFINNLVATFLSIVLLLIFQKISIISPQYYFHTLNLIFISLFILIFSLLFLSILIKRINSIKPNFILRGVK